MRIIANGQLLFVAALMCAALNAHAEEGTASVPAASSAVPMVGSGTPATSKAADRALRRRVLEALAKAKGLQASGVTVRARNGAVSLQGWVPEQGMIEQATQIASAVPGVTSVKNTLALSTF